MNDGFYLWSSHLSSVVEDQTVEKDKTHPQLLSSNC